jgi:hypothetical protein
MGSALTETCGHDFHGNLTEDQLEASSGQFVSHLELAAAESSADISCFLASEMPSPS